MSRLPKRWITVMCACILGIVLACIAILHAASPLPCPKEGEKAPTAFCTTPSEQALGEVPLHLPGISDAEIIGEGYSITTPPRGYVPKISQQRAVSIAVSCSSFPGSYSHGTMLALMHTSYGYTLPSMHPLWIVNVTPRNFPITQHGSWGGGPGTVPGATTWKLHVVLWTVNAESGKCEGAFYG